MKYNLSMPPALHSAPLKPATAPALTPAQLVDLVGKLERDNIDLRRQLAWFQRQIFGQKSEKRHLESESVQGILGVGFEAVPETPLPAKKTGVAGYERQAKPAGADESSLFFDEGRVPVEVIAVPNPEMAQLAPDQYEVIGEKVTHRLAQRPGSYVVLKYVRPLIKRKDTQALSCPSAPAGVIEGSRAEVSFVVGMVIDKFDYHLPLYRQHRRLADAGIKVSRAWLTQLMQSTVALLEPIYEAQLDSIRASRVKAMDETPIKAGRAGPGKMKTTYFWPIYGERDEICFTHSPSRAGQHVRDMLGLSPPEDGVLLSDGYAAYASYAKQVGLTHAQCWAHARREVYEARDIEPAPADTALAYIAALYDAEAHIRNNELSGAAKRAWRQAQAKPVAQRLFKWIDKHFEAQGFLPSSPFTKALNYIRERRAGLEVYLDDPDVAIDTNHLERALRVVPMGRNYARFKVMQS
ncbi:MAG: IS66 family transposase [Candidimonas sp.]|nr:MAG: IS66 family transposase [Candidimonas sp.]TAM25633.1 MAG: IS66 family transposase [Candidimonas sp.]TAM76005.1 MAG: IS66 family transposase [Candidimonas sp.]